MRGGDRAHISHTHSCLSAVYTQEADLSHPIAPRRGAFFMSIASSIVLLLFSCSYVFAWQECNTPPPKHEHSKPAPPPCNCGPEVISQAPAAPPVPAAPPAPVAAQPAAPVVVAQPVVAAVVSAPPTAPAAPAVVAESSGPPASSSSGRSEVCVYTVEGTNLLVELHGVSDSNRWVAEHSGRAGIPNDFMPAAGQMCGPTLTTLQQTSTAPAQTAPASALVPVQTPASPPENAAPTAPPTAENQTPPPVEEVQPPSQDIPEALPNAGDGSLAEEVVP